MRHFIVRDANGVIVADIVRSGKCTPLYEIHYQKAVDDIGWDNKHLVGRVDTTLIVYLLGGKEKAKEFWQWTEEE